MFPLCYHVHELYAWYCIVDELQLAYCAEMPSVLVFLNYLSALVLLWSL